jgi:hypothetical protein
MSARWAFRLAAISAVAMPVIALFMKVTEKACTTPMAPLTALQLVRSDRDIERIFGAPGQTCSGDPAKLVAELHSANLVDMFAYIPAYMAFFVLLAYALGRRDKVIGWAAIALSIACATADAVENMVQFQMTDAPGEAPPSLMALIIAVHAKWIGLAIVTTLCGVMLARRGGIGWIALATGVAPLATSLWAMAAPEVAGPFLLAGMFVPTTVLAGVALWKSFARENAPGA